MSVHGKNGRRVVIAGGCRLPFMRAGTEYDELRAYDLGRIIIKALVKKARFDPGLIDRVIMGNVISDIATTNVARDSALGAGIPVTVPAFTVTLACVSSNVAITAGMDLIGSGQADVVIAGGVESMSDIPIQYGRRFRKKLVESRKYKGVRDYLKFIQGFSFRDLLPEVPSIAEYSTGRIMGEDCDRLAARLSISREEQDEYAVRSHCAAARAGAKGYLTDEVEAVRVPPHFAHLWQDNGIRADASLEKMKRLKPVFEKKYGTVTAGNASFLTDGAAAVLLMSEEKASALGCAAHVSIRAYSYTAQDPEEDLLLGPAYAIPKVLDIIGLGLRDMDVFEFHEAFAGQILANLQCLDSDAFAREKLGRAQKVGEIPMERFNSWGGSLAIGHPFAATGARLVTTAKNRLVREDGTFALVASCAGGAIGNAIILERIH
ncbi:MAG: acetyl-CoA C-acyltransferase [Deltaproteobacteria bacterium]|nr:acetyl-CoA C-acyltransferase [Deltaproteobacteria bacterium]